MDFGNSRHFDLVCAFPRAWHRLHISPRLAPATHFPALGTGYTFSRAWHRLHISPRLVAATHFPALDSSYKIFPRLVSTPFLAIMAIIARSPALSSSFKIFSCFTFWHQLYALLRLFIPRHLDIMLLIRHQNSLTLCCIALTKIPKMLRQWSLLKADSGLLKKGACLRRLVKINKGFSPFIYTF